MDATKAVNSFIELCEFIPTKDTALDEPIVTTFPSTIHERDWTIVLNGDPTEEYAVEDVPASGATVTVRPTQALIFLGEQHAGIIGAGAGKFHEDEFESLESSVKEAFFNDFEEVFM
ncbi:hypothetical protein GS429_05820 [Natronorubrum sp. JWXQ-INN-674]|uniref:Uncharacterized protein n=1 Tax=Natronorubrum halalkaliphilum TaxID=2691917 RepID=A0A6B0VLY7_9EURY|nr:hypothetical protein [Natronorubrum halalkaliphilum]MXV61589.1 hypothetical protein [Natronorubrum halalkaliphilum]